MKASSTKNCEQCGSLFERDKRNTWAYWAKAKYCSQACAGLAWANQRERERPSIEESFLRYIVKADGCWSWSGPKDKDGYAVFFHARKQYRAPPFALKMDGREVPKGMMACHHCDNPECVRPDHLYVGTPQQNVDDMMRRGRSKFGFARRSA